MADSKDNSSFFRKVVRFVANPTTEWAEVGAPQEELRETEFAKSELKAMVERKRRNDFVRKREFDTLRKVRREGLTAEQLAALGGSSNLDDSDANRMAMDASARPDAGVKAKIDEIEQQMVGESAPAPLKRNSGFYNAPTQPAPREQHASPPPAPRYDGGRVVDAPELRAAPPPPAPPRAPEIAPLKFDAGAGFGNNPFAVEVSEVAHDPELDEAVISFANADFDQCEQALATLTGNGGSRAQNAETWLVLFDLYRATGQQHKFESLSLDYAQAFGWSAPQWFSMPKLVAEAASDERPTRSRRIEGDVGWVCPEQLDADEVARLSSQTLQMPLPWVFDWTRLQSVDVEACVRLTELFRGWMPQRLDMRWIGGERLLAVLAEAAPTGARDADPVYWQLRLDALRMANRADEFDEAAIDYCVTYEVSPPSWERPLCEVRIRGNAPTTVSPPPSQVSEAPTGFLETNTHDDGGVGRVASFELSGQLVGDISATLRKMDGEMRDAAVVNVSCARLIRVDFIAAGDLLNWVLTRKGEQRTVTFLESHRLVALFFGAMGISEHARVKVRTD